MEKRANFGSKLGIILASAGSAVGLGNVWRFPTEVGENGGAAFILIYILCVILLGVPLMVSEFVIGRHTHKNTSVGIPRLSGRLHLLVHTLLLLCGCRLDPEIFVLGYCRAGGYH